MNFRFFGDSWLWTWKRPLHNAGTPDEKYWYSDSMSKISDISHVALSLQSIILEKLGHSVSHGCLPGTSFYRTCDVIDLYANNFLRPHQKINFVIWVSSDLRSGNHPEWNMRSKDVFLDMYDQYVLRSLNKINDLAEIYNNINFIFVGGQSGLPKYVWDSIPDRLPNMHLLSEHIINTLSQENDELDNTNLSRFYIENEFIKLYDESDHKDEVDSALVNYMYEESAMYNDHDYNTPHAFNLLTYPDIHHLGYTGQIYFIDYLLKYCEDNNLL